ncbi:MAG TPA: response regulator [Ornithinibacter sp.]|nr:response regulator [Ornithinibacter sp.]
MPHGPERTVLILEDDPLIAAFMEKALRKKGYEVERFERGAHALERTSSGPAGVLLLDLGLPDLDGLEVLRRIRSAGSDLPVVVVTSRSDPGDRLEATALGVHGYIVKPFPLADLLRAVESSVAPA